MAKPDEPPDVDVRTLQTAKTLIARHGGGALTFAETQAARLAKDGKTKSAAEWTAVAAAIHHLAPRARRR